MDILIPVLILLAGPLTGIILQRRMKIGSQGFISHTVLFSGAFLMGITLFGLMPELFDHITQAGVWIVAGFLFQLFLERYTGGLGHGHIHSRDVPKSSMVLFAGLMTHALLEGYSAGLASYMEPGVIPGMVVGIAIHEIPASFSLSVLLASRWKNTSAVMLFLLLYALATPLGYISGVVVNNQAILSEKTSVIIAAIIAGTFLHISTTIVFENPRKKEGAGLKWGLIFAGLLVSYLACWLG